MLKNLLPQGTRAIELCSAYALLIVSLFLGCGLIFNSRDLSLLDNTMSWAFILGFFGFLQVYSIYYYPKVEVLRTVMSWLAGCFWLWVGVVSMNGHVTIEDIGALMLGVGNLYGFVINFNLIHVAWTD